MSPCRDAFAGLLAVVGLLTSPVHAQNGNSPPPPRFFPNHTVVTNGEFLLRTIPLRNSAGQWVQLRNHPLATNVSLRQLVSFLRSNRVNYAAFQPGQFVCTEFAQALHNAAEAAGLRAGVVLVDFEKGEGHVLNAFETTDKGVVYVDCTGLLPGNYPRHEFDTFGYLKVGHPYGRLPLDIGYPDPTNYLRYVQVDRIWTQMEADHARLEALQKRLADEARALRELAQKLGPPPWPPDRQAEARDWERRREALTRQEGELRQGWEDFRQRQKQWRSRIYHSNTNAVVRFKTWW